MKGLMIVRGILSAVVGLSLAGCGGSGGSGSTQNTTVGVITSFGSVFVNGCEYETDSASVTIDGQLGTEDDLSVGDVVEISGPSNCVTGTAASINYADELEGVVDSNAVSNGVGSMVVMGQNITINDLTIFEDKTGAVATIDAIAAGNVVEVSGFGVGTGDVVASRIEVKAVTHTPGNEIEVKGVVSNLDSAASTFSIGNLTVDYGSASLDDISVMEDGLYVEVKATDYTPGSFMLIAVKVEREGDGRVGHQGEDEEEFEIKGMLTAAYDNASKTFGVSDQMVFVDDAAELEHVALNDFVDANIGSLNLKVEGMFNANGVLVAKEVKLEDDISDNNEYRGTVTNLLVDGMNAGSLVMSVGAGSVDVIITGDTIMKDSHEGLGIAPEEKFNLTRLRVGDLIEVHVDPTSGIAIKLERK
jgi:hypothetical protein